VRIVVKTGDLLDEAADVIIVTANPWLNMSGGVNGAVLLRGGAGIQEELRARLRELGTAHAPAGSVHTTSAGPLSANHVLHAVAIDGFYESSVEIVAKTIQSAFLVAKQLGATSLAMPALATGYGPLSMSDFAAALATACSARNWEFASLAVVLKRPEDAETVRTRLRPCHQ
jgi:O-acetyl-ADP-ribose deacetylase (regulator of RNase III)